MIKTHYIQEYSVNTKISCYFLTVFNSVKDKTCIFVSVVLYIC